MAFTTVVDKSAGDQFTLTMWSTYIRDNLNKGVIRPIAYSLLGSPAASISFSSISATDFVHLWLIVHGRTTEASVVSGALLRFNGDTSAIYDYQGTQGSASTVVAAEVLAQTFISAGNLPGASATANVFGMSEIWIPNYAQTAFHKNAHVNNAHKGGTSTGTLRIYRNGGAWRSTAAINAVSLTASGGSLAAGTRAILLGMPSV